MSEPSTERQVIGAVLRRYRNSKVGWDQETGTFAVFFYIEPDRPPEFERVPGYESVALANDAVETIVAERVAQNLAAFSLRAVPVDESQVIVRLTREEANALLVDAGFGGMDMDSSAAAKLSHALAASVAPTPEEE